jgi:hypothetical protein
MNITKKLIRATRAKASPPSLPKFVPGPKLSRATDLRRAPPNSTRPARGKRWRISLSSVRSVSELLKANRSQNESLSGGCRHHTSKAAPLLCGRNTGAALDVLLHKLSCTSITISSDYMLRASSNDLTCTSRPRGIRCVVSFGQRFEGGGVLLKNLSVSSSEWLAPGRLFASGGCPWFGEGWEKLPPTGSLSTTDQAPSRFCRA